jgi:3-oxoacyl-(acyl-carrier-protein) synthase/3-hydroxymyristoyl/3-hydroxydecanoyl-(acyl carrier protein) dehydratase
MWRPTDFRARPPHELMPREPIAIVGQGCALPGALSPAALWAAVVEGRDLLSSAPEGSWRVSPEHIMGKRDPSGGIAPGRAWSDRGGYVQGFDEAFDPDGFQLPAQDIAGLDPLVKWCLHAGRQALDGVSIADPTRAGLIMGNLSYPSAAMAACAERVWLGDERADAAGVPRAGADARFMSGLPAHLVAQNLGLDGRAWALDAACASSLYALEMACQQLRDGEADLMLAGAVSCADDLFIHVGFCALKAMSPGGQSRPFHASADGLVPAQGAGLVALKRLSDAEVDGDAIAGVIRGIGLSNDGRGKGFLAPSSDRQIVAMRRAYAAAGLEPTDVSLVECHATGTVVGDGAEIQSMSEVFNRCDALPIGSLKSNMGHLITAAGVAGLLKVLGAIEHGIRPPTLHIEDPHAGLEGSPLRLLAEAEPWNTDSDGPRRAAVSAFGFGGNNAHLIVEAYEGPLPAHEPEPRPDSPVAIVGMGSILGDGRGVGALEVGLFSEGKRLEGEASQVEVGLTGLRFPPADLGVALPQQLLLLEAARDAVGGVATLPGPTTGVFVGMGCDPNIARHGGRWRLPQWCEAWGESDADWLEEAQEAFTPALGAPGVIGAMPNIVANRLNSQLDLGGASMAVSSEELSGVRALEVAARALRHGELDAALVGAVDMSCDPVHGAAIRAAGLDERGADGAVVLVLKRLDDAITDGDRVLALLDDGPSGSAPARASAVSERWGLAHAASGLFEVAAAALACARGRHIGGEMWSGSRAMRLRLEALGGQTAEVALRSLGEDRVAPSSATAPGSAGPSLTFPARLPPVALPYEPAAEAAPILPTVVQVMAAAPRLPPVLGPAPLIAAATRPAPIAAPAHPLTEAHARLQAIHQAYVDHMTTAHAAFLAQQEAASRILLAAAGGVVLPEVELPAPLQSPPPPAPVAVAVAVAVPMVAPTSEARIVPQAGGVPTGPTFSREDLEHLATGRISERFGPLFEQQDGYALQVRMPEPPLLLADRVTGIDAEPGSMGKGTIWTETDVLSDGWYLHDGRIPAGVMIESGQADLLLISWLGIDFLNKGERAYRLLGCELTYHGGLPRPGDTLSYDIHVDGHAAHGDVRLFFFHYDCRVDGASRLSVREGQAGFFTVGELADSMGILWSPEEGEHTDTPRLDPPPVARAPASLGRAQLEAFAAGETFACFGEGFERAQTHTRSPRIAGDSMLFLHDVTHVDRAGGPWGRGYLRATWDFQPDDWFFDGHFKGDPCMPGTLMLEGCLQAMAVYMTSLGFTVNRDGWVFEPEPDLPYQLRCRGQATPASRLLEYEVFVEEVVDGDRPTLYADLLCTVDGRKAFHCRRMGLQLIPGWPLDSRPELLASPPSGAAPAQVDGFTFDYASLLASAWGRPSQAFGPMYASFDGPKRVARLPGPPYHFMSRVTRVQGPIGEMVPGAEVELEYDIPPDAWYFDDNGARTMPMCVLLEAALQPCGWLASYVGSALTSDSELFFRNLGGTSTLHHEFVPTTGTLRTHVKLLSVSSSGGMIIQSFEVSCFVGDRLFYEVETVFGFFPQASLQDQKGLPIGDEHAAELARPGNTELDLRARPERYFDSSARLPADSLLMLDQLTGWWPGEGEAGLGKLRAEGAVDASAWFFKAHFFQDPVQPGSLGLEAMVQLLQLGMLELGMDEGLAAPRFEPIALAKPLTWLYRGQVIPDDALVTITMELTERGEDPSGPWLQADASLWVDGRRIYEAQGLVMRLVDGARP